jgi:hypothetical protein
MVSQEAGQLRGMRSQSCLLALRSSSKRPRRSRQLRPGGDESPRPHVVHGPGRSRAAQVRARRQRNRELFGATRAGPRRPTIREDHDTRIGPAAARRRFHRDRRDTVEGGIAPRSAGQEGFRVSEDRCGAGRCHPVRATGASQKKRHAHSEHPARKRPPGRGHPGIVTDSRRLASWGPAASLG